MIPKFYEYIYFIYRSVRKLPTYTMPYICIRMPWSRYLLQAITQKMVLPSSMLLRATTTWAQWGTFSINMLNFRILLLLILLNYIYEGEKQRLYKMKHYILSLIWYSRHAVSYNAGIWCTLTRMVMPLEITQY